MIIEYTAFGDSGAGFGNIRRVLLEGARFREGFRMKSETGTLTTIYMHIRRKPVPGIAARVGETGVAFSTTAFIWRTR